MKILLDTHMLIWIITGDKHLGKRAKQLFLDERNEVYYSLVSLWEISLKRRKHPENCPINENDCAMYAEQSGIETLGPKPEHIFGIPSLKIKEGEYIGNEDPFDQLLLSQAKSEGCFFMTHDTLMQHYDENFILSV